MRSRRRATVVAGFLALALAGCRTEVVSDGRLTPRPVTVRTEEVKPRPRPQPPQPSIQPADPQATALAPGEADPLAEQEPCAARLHDVAGVMLLYYALHKRLPADLEDLRAVADVDQALDFTCPASGRPYVYVPAGLRYPGKDERLVLYDAEPAHAAGSRWGILAAPPKGDRPAAMWAVRLSAEGMKAYLESAEPADER